ncbi:hypothetical protein MHSWG343_03910 [Candidatus Mycoplasma haematohominis]|uniref:Uncharacterized protein n=1 Tax=Candidatus Mycoplasma haematohominis TaxID=1494318 RepID=A0A478FTH5_9MOLU|nr:hypothetical protein MHSWG343_03910 [Candidatus Mycoplasma haemohominis]
MKLNLEVLIERLKVEVPDIESILDREKIAEAERTGVLDEGWLLKHIRDGKKAKASSDVTEKLGCLSTSLVDGSLTSLVGCFRDFDSFISGSVSTFLLDEEKISKIIFDYLLESRSKDFAGIKESVEASKKFWESEIDELSRAKEKDIDSCYLQLISAVRDFSDDSYQRLGSTVKNQMDKFKEESRRAAKTQKELWGDCIHDVLKGKVEKWEQEGRSLNLEEKEFELTNEEKEVVKEKIKSALKDDVANQRRIRKETMDVLSGEVLGVSGSDKVVEFLEGVSVISREDKDLLGSLAKDDYLTSEEIKRSVLGQDADLYKFSRLKSEMHVLENDYQRKLDEIYESNMWKFCNGGWWSPFSHVISFGFCSGYSAVIALVSLYNNNQELFRKIATWATIVAVFAGSALLFWKARLPFVGALAAQGIVESFNCALREISYGNCDPLELVYDVLTIFAEGIVKNFFEKLMEFKRAVQ